MIGAKRGAELHVSKGSGAGYQEGGTKKEMWGGGGGGGGEGGGGGLIDLSVV